MFSVINSYNTCSNAVYWHWHSPTIVLPFVYCPVDDTLCEVIRKICCSGVSSRYCCYQSIKSNCTFIRRLLKSDFSQAPPTSMRAQTRQFLTIARTVPVRCPRSSDCQADCSTLWGLLGPKRTVRVREMISSPWSADRSRARAGTEWTGVDQFSMVSGS